MAYAEWQKERHAQGLPAPYDEYRAVVKEQNRASALRRSLNKTPTSKKLKTVESFAEKMLRRSQSRAQKKGWEHNLDIEWLMEKVSAGKCEVTGIEFTFAGSKHPWQPSIDRIDSNRGYTKDNCQLVVWMYNCAKMDNEHKDLIILAKALINNSNLH